MTRPAAPGSVSPIDDRTGLIRYVVDIPVEPGEPEIFNASVKLADVAVYNDRSCYDNNGGSGLTRHQARGAAIGEGIERYCCSVYDAEDLLCGSVRALSSAHELCPPQRFALFHPHQPGGRSMPANDVPIAWAWAWATQRRRPVLVPASLVYMPYYPCFKEHGEQVVAPAVSTGLACADTLDRALLNGTYELVERDAFVIAWYNRMPLPKVDITSHDAVRRVYEHRFRREGLRYEVRRMTTDIRLPSYLCLLIDERRTPPMVCVGGATHLDPVTAVVRAMKEAVQTREWAKFLGRDRQFSFAPDFSDIQDFEDHVALYAYGDMLHAVGFWLDDGPEEPEDWVSLATGDPATDLRVAFSTLAYLGLEVLALDLTSADVKQCGYRVTRVMVPELQPLDASYEHRFLGGERMHDVPQRLGFTSTRSTLEDLNPYPHPYP